MNNVLRLDGARIAQEERAAGKESQIIIGRPFACEQRVEYDRRRKPGMPREGRPRKRVNREKKNIYGQELE